MLKRCAPLFLFPLTFVWFLFFQIRTTHAQQPDHNVLLIIADDYGLDVSSLYTTNVNLPPIPNLEALAQEGILFTNAWSNPICSPTRATMLTGRYGFRTGMGSIPGTNQPSLPFSELALPEALDLHPTLDYAHANFGKWHLGGGVRRPNQSGWEHYSGILSGGVPSYEDWTKVTNGESVNVTEYVTTHLVDEAITWIDTQVQQSRPWVAWVAFNAPHTPYHLPPLDLHSYDALSPDEAAINQNPASYYFAAIEAMDTEIGRMLDSLTDTVRANTTVIFVGDNGTPNRVRQGIPAGRAKGTLYQGGINIPMIVAGPLVESPNRVEDALVNLVDVYPTVLELTGISVTQTVPITLDGVSLLPYFVSQDAPNQRLWAYSEVFNSGNPDGELRTIRDVEFKLMRWENGDAELYRIAIDTDESNDLLDTTDPLDTDVQSHYCSLSRDMNALLLSEGVVVPALPDVCQAVPTAVGTQFGRTHHLSTLPLLFIFASLSVTLYSLRKSHNRS